MGRQTTRWTDRAKDGPVPPEATAACHPDALRPGEERLAALATQSRPTTGGDVLPPLHEGRNTRSHGGTL